MDHEINIALSVLPRVKRSGSMPFLGIDLDVAVLDDCRAVLSQKSAISLLGMSRGKQGERLAFFAGQNALKPYIHKHFPEGNFPTVHYETEVGGHVVPGCEADTIVSLCLLVREAARAGALRSNQQHIAAQAEIIIEAAARTGLAATVRNFLGEVEPQGALVDEFHARIEQAAGREIAHPSQPPAPEPLALATPNYEIRRLELQVEHEKLVAKATDAYRATVRKHPGDEAKRREAAALLLAETGVDLRRMPRPRPPRRDFAGPNLRLAPPLNPPPPPGRPKAKRPPAAAPANPEQPLLPLADKAPPAKAAPEPTGRRMSPYDVDPFERMQWHGPKGARYQKKIPVRGHRRGLRQEGAK